MIQHIWFDLEETLTIRSREAKLAHDELRYKTYAKVVKKPLSNDLRQEYEGLYCQLGSNSAVFRSLGLPSDYWQKAFGTLNESLFYQVQPDINQTLKQLKKTWPISLFTNSKRANILSTLKTIEIPAEWFTYIISGDDIKERKPALDGFRLMIEKSQLPPEKILYVGDRVDVDIKPAKELGLKTCLVYSKSELADYSFKNLKDILTIIH